MQPTTNTLTSSVLPCSYYDEEVERSVLDKSERQDIANKNIFFYTYYGNYGVEHTHDYWEFILILAGNYTHALNGRNFQLNTHHACLLRPNLDRHSLKNAPIGSKHLTIRIRDSYMKELCDNIEKDFYQTLMKRPIMLCSLDNTQSDHIINYTTIIQNLSAEKAVTPTFFLVTYLLEKFSNSIHYFETDKPKWFSELLLKINASENMHWSVNDIVENSHFSHSHLLRAFKKYENCSLSDYLAKVKMLYACNLILYSSLSILDIALMLGYSDSSHLNRTFKKTYNLSPTQFKRLYKG